MLIRNKTTDKTGGYVLLEIIIYVALFSIMIGGLIVSSFQLIQNGGKTGSRVVVQEEMNFVLKKIDWVLTGASSIDSPAVGVTADTLSVTKGGNTVTIEFDSANSKIKLNDEYISTINVHVDSLSFKTLAGTPKGVEVSVVIDGQTASFKKYLKI